MSQINIKDHTNDIPSQNRNPVASQKGFNSSGGAAATALYPAVMTVDGIAVRLRFSDSGSLSAKLAGAFNSMLE